MARLKKTNTGMVLLLGIGVLAAMLFGLISAVANGWIALLLFAPVLPVLFVLRDFRVGVVLLIVLLPFQNSPLLPQFSGFNLVNYMVLATMGSLVLSLLFSREATYVRWPRIVWWAYLLPIACGTVLGLLHVKSAPQVQELVSYSTPYVYLTATVLKPLFTMLVAWMLGTAVSRSERPQLFLIPIVLASVLPAFSIFAFVAKSGLSLQVLGSEHSRTLLGVLGMHANGFGQFFGLAFTMLLFISPLATRLRDKVALFTSIAIVTLALLLTFSRGGWVVAAVGGLSFVLVHRRMRYVFILLFVLVAAAAFMPDAIVDRLMVGISDSQVQRVPGKFDALTAGRVWLWKTLLPDFWHSPLWGSGVGSVAWSSPVRAGIFYFVHPHNVFLRILLDLGVAGFLMFFLFFRYLVRQAIAIARAPDTPPALRAVAQGVAASVVAMFLGDMAGGHYLAGPEQVVLWMSIGLLLPTLKRMEPVRNRTRAQREARFAMAPLPPLPPAPAMRAEPGQALPAEGR